MRYDEWPKAFHSHFMRNVTAKTSLGTDAPYRASVFHLCDNSSTISLFDMFQVHTGQH